MRRRVERRDFRALQRMLKQHTGVVLDEGKEYLVTSRLTSLLHELELELPDLLSACCQDSALRWRVLDALLNHETSFFRDWAPFQGIREELLPELCEQAEARGERTLRFWCGACSSGQEPYSLAMLVLEALDMDRWRVEITASDVSGPVLESAQRGTYIALDVNRGLPSQALLRHFDQDGIRWKVRPEVRELVRFRQLNLVEPWPSLPPFDLVFVRNVLIYFDVETRRQILERLQTVLRPTGYLLLGAAELTVNLTRDFTLRRIGKSIFFRRKRG